MKTKYNSTANWYLIAGNEYYLRSKWEANYAHFLQWKIEKGLIQSWKHEPETFLLFNRLGNVIRYKPDFLVHEHKDREDTLYYVEVKGYMTQASKMKIAAFKREYPEKNLIVIDSKWFRANNGKLKGLVPGWI